MTSRNCRNYLWLFFGVIAFYSATPRAFAHDDDIQSWNLLTGTGSISAGSNFRWYSELQLRVGNEWQDVERLIVRPALFYTPRPDLSLWFGHAWTPGFVDAKFQTHFRDEHRIWQQVMLKDTRDNVLLSYRLRQEQRFIDDLDTVAHRSRISIRADSAKPVFYSSELGDVGLSLFNEFFLNLNEPSDAQESGFDRNRLYFGAYHELQSGRLDAGVLGEYSKRPGTEPRRIFALLVSFSFKVE